MKQYACYMGTNEATRYVTEARNIPHLRIKLGKEFGLWGRWYKQKSLDWNMKKFLIVHNGKRETITIILGGSSGKGLL